MAQTVADIKNQSINTHKQWAAQWRAQAKAHKKFDMKPMDALENSGIGKALLLVANGYSFELNKDTIIKHKDNVDIMACDKTLGHLLDLGIKPKYCLVCDANVSYEKFMAKWVDQLDETILLMNVTANPKWSHQGNWKDIYFFVNRDVMKYEREWMEISGCQTAIVAGTNVSNAMVIMAFQADDKGSRNFFGYDKVLLVGFDYSWMPTGKYYAFDESGLGGKNHYMRHITTVNQAGKMAFTSNNLQFSAEWLEKYIKNFNLPVVLCAKESILNLNVVADLDSQMQYKFKPEHGPIAIELLKKRDALRSVVANIDGKLQAMQKEHWKAVQASI